MPAREILRSQKGVGAGVLKRYAKYSKQGIPLKLKDNEKINIRTLRMKCES